MGVAVPGGGCASDAPRSRLGALPFPGTFTLYTTADPEHLGRHRYGRTPRLFQADEKERGILYTTRGGFLDLAHVRIAADWTRYYTRHVRRAIREGDSELTLAAMNNSRLHLTLRYPQECKDLPPAEREALDDELALRAGQQLALATVTWHEVITWFGFRTVLLVDEAPSAFTYDDTMAHLVGVRVGAAALRDKTLGYDSAVTAALSAELKRLGAARPKQTDLATRAVEGRWWAHGQPLKRQFEVGLAEDVVYPWLVPNLPFAAGAEPEPFGVLSLSDVLGHDASGFYTARMESDIWEVDRMRQHLDGRPEQFGVDRDLPVLLAVARSEVLRRFGPEADQPGRAPPAPPPPPAVPVAARPPAPPPAPPTDRTASAQAAENPTETGK